MREVLSFCNLNAWFFRLLGKWSSVYWFLEGEYRVQRTSLYERPISEKKSSRSRWTVTVGSVRLLETTLTPCYVVSSKRWHRVPIQRLTTGWPVSRDRCPSVDSGSFPSYTVNGLPPTESTTPSRRGWQAWPVGIIKSVDLFVQTRLRPPDTLRVLFSCLVFLQERDGYSFLRGIFSYRPTLRIQWEGTSESTMGLYWNFFVVDVVLFVLKSLRVLSKWLQTTCVYL